MGKSRRSCSITLVALGALGVLFEQALAFQAATFTLTDQPSQILELVSIWCLDALKTKWSVIAVDVNTI